VTPLAFFAPHFLWALPLVVLPLVVHLLNRKRTRTLRFSSLRFFGASVVSANRSRTLRRWLLWVIRTLLVIAVVLLFARPFNRSNPFALLGNPHLQLLCWVDPSVSMDYRVDSLSRYDAAVASLDTLRQHLAPTASLRLFDVRAGEFVEGTGAAVLRQSRRMHGDDGFDAFVNALQRPQVRGAPSVALVYSDLQQPFAQRLRRVLQSDSLGMPVIIVNLAPASPWNHSLKLNAVPREGQTRLEAALSALGRPLEQGRVAARVGGMGVGSVTISAPAGEQVEQGVEVAQLGAGATGELVLEQHDPFEPDNRVYFAATAQGAARILVVGEFPRSYPVVAAVQAGGAERGLTVVQRTPGELTIEAVDSAAVIILDGICNSFGTVQSILGSAVVSDKSIVAALATGESCASFNAQLLKAIGAGRGGSARKGQGAGIELCDTISPLWRGFPRLLDRDVRINGYVSGLEGRVLARLSSGEPYISSAQDSRGNHWFVLASPLGIDEANNVAETGFMVPLLHRLIQAGLQRGGGGSEPWVAGVARQNPFLNHKSGARVYDAAGEPLGVWEKQPLVLFDSVGLYQIRPHQGAAYWIAAVIDSAESRLIYDTKVIAPQSQQRSVLVQPTELVPLLQRHATLELSRLLWLVIALLLLTEMVLWQGGTLFRPGPRRQPPR
jgi:hypothetical protein